MNERIKQLIGQCTDQKNWSGPGLYKNFDKEKFAVLIIQECIQVGGPEDSYTDEWFKAKADSIVKIKEHFGVE